MKAIKKPSNKKKEEKPAEAKPAPQLFLEAEMKYQIMLYDSQFSVHFESTIANYYAVAKIMDKIVNDLIERKDKSPELKKLRSQLIATRFISNRLSNEFAQEVYQREMERRKKEALEKAPLLKVEKTKKKAKKK